MPADLISAVVGIVLAWVAYTWVFEPWKLTGGKWRG